MSNTSSKTKIGRNYGLTQMAYTRPDCQRGILKLRRQNE